MTSTDLCGEAVVKCAHQLNKVLDAYPTRKPDGSARSFKERVQMAMADGHALEARGEHNSPWLFYDFQKQYGNVSYFFVWGAGLSVVEVDLLSGGYRVLKTALVQDTGKSLNPHLDVGQVCV
jgi:xanthine dehydrogenase large subunit